MDLLKLTRIVLALYCLAFSATSQAIPMLDFVGELAFNPGTNVLSVTGQINGASPEFDSIATEVLGSSLELTVVLDPLSIFANTVVNPPFPTTTTIVAEFKTGAGTDLQITNLATTLLAGDIVDPLIMAGKEGGVDGNLSGEFLPTSGDLLGYFTLPSSLFALELNVTNPFSIDMYDTGFTGLANGNIAAIAGNPPAQVQVPEPPVLVLLVMALASIVTVRRLNPMRDQ